MLAKEQEAAEKLKAEENAKLANLEGENFDAEAAAEAKVQAIMKASADAKAAEKAKLAATFESRDPTAIWLKERGLRLDEWRQVSLLPPPREILLETGEIAVEQSNIGSVDWLMQLVERIGHGSGPKMDEHLEARTTIKGARHTLMQGIGYLLSVMASADLRDNLIDDTECGLLAEAISPRGVKLSKVTFAGNRIHASGLAALAKALSVLEEFADGTKKWRSSSVTELDLSRNRLVYTGSDGPSDADGTTANGATAAAANKEGAESKESKESKEGAEGAEGALAPPQPSSYEGLDELARSCANSSRLSILNLARTGLDDAAGTALFRGLYAHAPKAEKPPVFDLKTKAGKAAAALAALQPPPKPPAAMALMKLDLSHNQLRASFGAALADALKYTPALIQLNLRHNGLGVEGGVSVARAVTNSSSLKLLDLTANNLCDCNPMYASSSQPTWRGEAVEALADMLMSGCSLQNLILSHNELAGMWSERIGGGWATMGTYTTNALELLCTALEKERLPLRKRDGIEVEGE